MDTQHAIDLAREAVLTAILLSSPALVAGLAIGLVVSLLQAVTQIQEQTISFVPKLLGILAALTLCLPWLIEYLTQYTEQVITDIPSMF